MVIIAVLILGLMLWAEIDSLTRAIVFHGTLTSNKTYEECEEIARKFLKKK